MLFAETFVIATVGAAWCILSVCKALSYMRLLPHEARRRYPAVGRDGCLAILTPPLLFVFALVFWPAIALWDHCARHCAGAGGRTCCGLGGGGRGGRHTSSETSPDKLGGLAGSTMGGFCTGGNVMCISEEVREAERARREQEAVQYREQQQARRFVTAVFSAASTTTAGGPGAPHPRMEMPGQYCSGYGGVTVPRPVKLGEIGGRHVRLASCATEIVEGDDKEDENRARSDSVKPPAYS